MRRVLLPLPLPDAVYGLLRRLRDRFAAGGSAAAPNLAGDRDVEWSWVAANLSDPGAGRDRALDFGPGRSSLGLVAAR